MIRKQKKKEIKRGKKKSMSVSMRRREVRRKNIKNRAETLNQKVRKKER